LKCGNPCNQNLSPYCLSKSVVVCSVTLGGAISSPVVFARKSLMDNGKNFSCTLFVSMVANWGLLEQAIRFLIPFAPNAIPGKINHHSIGALFSNGMKA